MHPHAYSINLMDVRNLAWIDCMREKLMAAVVACFVPLTVLACTAEDGIPDYNCDGKVVVSVIGDSLAYGFGDTVNGNQGGYVLRTSRKFPEIKFHNLGVQGLKTFQLLSKLRRVFKDDSDIEYREDLLESDVVILDLGRNDRWLFGEPAATYRNLKRAASNIVGEVLKRADSAPLVVKAVLMLPNRGSQGPWVKALNELILNSNSLNYPADLRFDLVSKRLLSSDQIHPTPAGYVKLAQTLVSYLKKPLTSKIKKLRVDTDSDKVPDYFETNRYGTDPQSADTDGDGVGDGDELFLHFTDPLAP